MRFYAKEIKLPNTPYIILLNTKQHLSNAAYVKFDTYKYKFTNNFYIKLNRMIGAITPKSLYFQTVCFFVSKGVGSGFCNLIRYRIMFYSLSVS